jgi:TIR domain
MAGPDIFISYRRGDAAASARALYLVLRNWFGADRIFFDHAGLQPGERFEDRLGQAIAQSRVVLAVIGKTWLVELNNRLPREAVEPDVVRAELKQALELQA